MTDTKRGQVDRSPALIPENDRLLGKPPGPRGAFSVSSNQEPKKSEQTGIS